MPNTSRYALTLVLSLALAGATAHAGDQQQFTQLEHEVGAAFQKQDYETAAKKCFEQTQIAPNQPGPYYNLACALARQKKTDEAFAALEKSIEKGYNDPAHMKSDEDLNNLHEDKRFAELAKKAGDNEKKGGGEAGANIDGVKTVEDFPEGGLRYRLRMSPDATAEKPNKLIIWLHPSGGSMNQQVEQMALGLNKMGYALLVTTQKNWNFWSGDDAAKLLNGTLPAVAKIAGIDVKKPILMGFSAGGQLALQLWEQNPEGFGGMILDAAYPIDMAAYQQGQQKAMQLPKNEAIKSCPQFVLVGDADPGHQMWKQVEDNWRKAGLPLEIDYVKGGRHQWLVGPEQWKELKTWLIAVHEGKLPGKLEANVEAKKDPAPAAKPNDPKVDLPPGAGAGEKKDAPKPEAKKKDDANE